MTHRILLAVAFCCTTSVVLGDANWPQWRGPDRNDISQEKGLLKEWPSSGPKRLWLFSSAGVGYSGFSIVGNRLYTMGSRDSKELVIALDTSGGKEVWATEVGGELDNNWGNGPRGTPTVDGDHVYALAGRGTLACLKRADGKLAWKKSMEDLGGKVPDWGYTESVLVEGDKVICTPGGKKGAIAAFNKLTGDLVWQSKDFTDGAQYSSIIPANLNGVRQCIQLTMNSIAGVDAANGALLWRSEWPGRVAVIPTPIYSEGHVYVTSGYGVGCKLIKIEAGNKVTEVYNSKEMKNHHGGVVLVGKHLYGYSDGPGWLCQEFLTGKKVWAEKKLGKGAVSCADGMLYLVSEDSGTVVLIEASPEGWKEHGRFKLDPQTKLRKPEGRIWTHPVITDGKLFLRDQDLIYCYDVKSSS